MDEERAEVFDDEDGAPGDLRALLYAQSAHDITPGVSEHTEILNKDLTAVPKSRFLDGNELSVVPLKRDGPPIATLRDPQAVLVQSRVLRDLGVQILSGSSGKIEIQCFRKVFERPS